MKMLITTVYTEFTKTKSSFAFWLVVLGAGFVPLFFALHHIYDWRQYLPEVGENQWHEYFRKGFNGVHFTLLPMLVVLLAALLMNIEHKSNGWKQMFVLPLSKSDIFIGKYAVSLGLILLFYCVLLACFILGGFILGLWKSEFGFLGHSPEYSYATVHSSVAAFIVRSYISTLGIMAMHLWLGFRVKNLFMSIGIGLGGIVIAISIYIPHWASIVYFPYAFPILMCNYIPDSYHFLSDFQINSLIYFAGFTFLSYLDFTRYFKG
jgi:lantibiotic transport system permease protein